MLKDMFSDNEGRTSSTRALGCMGWIVGLVLSCIGHEEAVTVLSASAALLGAGQLRAGMSTKTHKLQKQNTIEAKDK